MRGPSLASLGKRPVLQPSHPGTFANGDEFEDLRESDEPCCRHRGQSSHSYTS